MSKIGIEVIASEIGNLENNIRYTKENINCKEDYLWLKEAEKNS